MIKQVKILNSKDSILHKCWGARTFNFSDKVNIIFGKNGCGKSILLSTIAHYAGIDKRGWSSPLTPHRSNSWSWKDDGKDYMKIINHSSSLGKIKMNWDGVPAYKSETSRDSGSMLSNIMQGLEPEEMELGEAMNLKFNAVSSGQNVAYFINRLQSLQIPDISKAGHENSNDVWKFYGSLLSNYVKKLPRKGKPTLLMDEPDKSLDYKSQNLFWNKIVDALSERWQVIIVTHSAFALSRTKDNIIDQNNYFKESGLLINKVFKH